MRVICPLVLRAQVNQGFVVPARESGGQERAAPQFSPDREDSRPIRVANIPFGSLRIILGRRFGQTVAMINHAVLGFAAFRTPASVRYAAPDRPIERGPVSARLPTRDYFTQFRGADFSLRMHQIPASRRLKSAPLFFLSLPAVSLGTAPQRLRRSDLCASFIINDPFL